MDFYELARGPMAWIAFSFCIVGTIVRLAVFFARAKKLKRLHPEKIVSGGLKSIFRGMLPFGLTYMREKPVFTIVTFGFHVCVLITPLFFLSHIVLVYESWQIQWISLPDSVAYIMAMVVILAVLFFFTRRLLIKEVKQLTRLSDILILIVIALVFLSGMSASHHWGQYRPPLIAHIVTGEILLVMIPFSKLMHMFMYFFTRGYLGAEYNIVLDTKYL
jgi:nitrate reductase gamma subunit